MLSFILPTELPRLARLVTKGCGTTWKCKEESGMHELLCFIAMSISCIFFLRKLPEEDTTQRIGQTPEIGKEAQKDFTHPKSSMTQICKLESYSHW